MIGQTVGSYRVTKKLAEGGMGAVYVGEHAVMGREAVIKVLLPELSVNKEMVSRFFNEARAAASIHHPGIVEVHDVGFLGGQAYIVMEKLRGETLATRITREKKLPLDRAVKVIRQLAGALAAAHKGGIVHRDLKPDNIFLVPDPEVPGGERVKVLDFGIAKLSTGAGSVATKAGSIFGTPAYMAPEQCRDAADVDHRADVYAIGCIFYELLTGRPPFGRGGIELLASHLRDTPESPATLDPTIPPLVAGMVVTMLAKQPAHRYPSCDAFIAALDQTVPSMSQPAIPRVLASHEMATVMAPSTPNVAPVATPGPVAVASNPGTMPLTTHSGAASEISRAEVPAGPRGKGGLIAAGAAVLVVGGVVAFLLMRRGSKAPAAAPATPDAAVVATVVDAAVTRVDPAAENRWVRIVPPAERMLLGVAADAPETTLGFRPDRAIAAPKQPYELQQHEVTWGELEPWLAEHKDIEVRRPATLPPDRASRAKLPATGVPWTAAYEYCKSIGGVLPSEEQWELAARGAEGRAAAWGDARLDPVLTHAFAGDAWTLAPVMTSDQDRTPDAEPIFDLMGNAREWSADVWREDRAADSDDWAVEGGMTYRAVRGLPLAAPQPATLQRELAAYREPLCATGPCMEKAWELLASVGFRCARAAR